MPAGVTEAGFEVVVVGGSSFGRIGTDFETTDDAGHGRVIIRFVR